MPVLPSTSVASLTVSEAGTMRGSSASTASRKAADCRCVGAEVRALKKVRIDTGSSSVVVIAVNWLTRKKDGDARLRPSAREGRASWLTPTTDYGCSCLDQDPEHVVVA